MPKLKGGDGIVDLFSLEKLFDFFVYRWEMAAILLVMSNGISSSFEMVGSHLKHLKW